MNDILLFFACKYEGDSKKIINAIERHEQINLIELEEYKSKVKEKFITLLDKDYPNSFKMLNEPPIIIFYKGDISLLNERSLAFIGSRKNSEYGEEMVERLVKPLCKKYVIVSGLAKGIDGLAHKCCLENNGKTIAVLGNGIDYHYPYSNKNLQIEIENKGLIISEYPSFIKPKKENFPKRNRIIAALSLGIVVIESKIKSGTMITVEHALNLGKDIFCVPNLANCDSGCNHLIKMGAYLVENANDISENL